MQTLLATAIHRFQDEGEVEESDAQIEGGDAGQKAEDMANDLIGERDPASAVFFYGVYTSCMALGFILFWEIMKSNSWVAMYKEGVLSRVTFYGAAGTTWLMVSFFDGEYMREIYRDIQALSIFGPFFIHWYAFGLYMIAMLDTGDAFDYIMLAFWGAETVFEQLFQIILLPKVFEWADTAPILDNDVQKEENQEDEDEDEKEEKEEEEGDDEE